jgi:hypothetical protein
VAAAHFGHLYRGAVGSADTLDLIGRDRDPNSCSTKEDSPVNTTFGDCPGDLFSKLRIIDRVTGVRPEVDDLEIRFPGQIFFDLSFQYIAAVVGAQCDFFHRFHLF